MELVVGHFLWFMPLLLFLAAMVGYHYFYYYRDTKSIYLIRRLEKPGFLIKSCCGGPLMWSVLGIVVAALLFGLYYGCYLLAMPAESLPRFL